MSEQNLRNHTRLVPPFHFVLLPALLLGVVGSFVNLRQSMGDHQRLYSASLIVLVTIGLVTLALYARLFALKAQDRAIRAEENLRHFVLTGKLLDPRLSLRQIVGLALCGRRRVCRAGAESRRVGLSQKDIKKAITHWKADHDRV